MYSSLLAVVGRAKVGWVRSRNGIRNYTDRGRNTTRNKPRLAKAMSQALLCRSDLNDSQPHLAWSRMLQESVHGRWATKRMRRNIAVDESIRRLGQKADPRAKNGGQVSTPSQSADVVGSFSYARLTMFDNWYMCMSHKMSGRCIYRPVSPTMTRG